MTDDLAIRVAKLEAAEEIRHLKARYAAICDNGYLPEPMRPLFTADAVWDGGDKFGRHEGFDAIYAFFDGVSASLTWALHYMVAPIVEVADDLTTATGQWYLWQPCTIVTPDGPQATWLTGTYADRYRREDGVWKFSEVKLTFECITPIDQGWVRKQFWDE